MFEAECQALHDLNNCHSIRVPKPIGSGVANKQSFIVMEYIDLVGRADEVLLGQQLATLHLNTKPKFGYSMDNTIGSTPQLNQVEGNWVQFWQKFRLGH